MYNNEQAKARRMKALKGRKSTIFHGNFRAASAVTQFNPRREACWLQVIVNAKQVYQFSTFRSSRFQWWGKYAYIINLSFRHIKSYFSPSNLFSPAPKQPHNTADGGNVPLSEPDWSNMLKCSSWPKLEEDANFTDQYTHCGLNMFFWASGFVLLDKHYSKLSREIYSRRYWVSCIAYVFKQANSRAKIFSWEYLPAAETLGNPSIAKKFCSIVKVSYHNPSTESSFKIQGTLSFVWKSRVNIVYAAVQA